MRNDTIKIRVVKEVVYSRIFKIVDEKLWKKKKNWFIDQINSDKDMGNYLDSDYCQEEYGIEFEQEHPQHDDDEWGDVLDMRDEENKKV